MRPSELLAPRRFAKSAVGTKRTSAGTLWNVCFLGHSRHFAVGLLTSAFDPKRTFLEHGGRSHQSGRSPTCSGALLNQAD